METPISDIHFKIGLAKPSNLVLGIMQTSYANLAHKFKMNFLDGCLIQHLETPSVGPLTKLTIF